MIAKLHLGHYPLVLVIEKFFGTVFRSPGRQNDNTMIDLSFVHTRPNQHFGCKVPFEAGKSNDE